VPPEILRITEKKHIIPYLEARQLMQQYEKVKAQLLSGDTFRTSFKELNPQNSGIWSFRINKQFRAHSIFNGNTLRVYKIDNHQ